jgi:hypothetical protein
MMSDSSRIPPHAPASVPLLISSEFVLHREAFARVLRTLRPYLQISLAEPAQADAVVAQLRPSLVICGALSTTIERLVPAWIVIPSDPSLTSSVGGQGRTPNTIPHPSVEALVRLVDDLWTPTVPGSSLP